MPEPADRRSPMTADVLAAARLRFALRRFLTESDRIAREAGLTPRRYLLLLALESIEREGRTPTVGDVAQTLGLAQSTVTGLLDRAEQVGLVRRTQSGRDARVVHVRATRAGRRQFEMAFAGHEGERRSLGALLSEAEPTSRLDE